MQTPLAKPPSLGQPAYHRWESSTLSYVLPWASQLRKALVAPSSEHLKSIAWLTGNNSPRLAHDLAETGLATRYFNLRNKVFGHESASRLVRLQLSQDFIEDRAKRAPTILLFWHAGILPVVFAGLRQLNEEVAIIKSRDAFPQHSQGLRHFYTTQHSAQDQFGNARLLKQAASYLKTGNIMATFLDGTNGSSAIRARFFGHDIALKRGTATLARVARATIYPCIARWDTETRRYVFSIANKLPSDKLNAGEASFMQACVDYFESYLRCNPQDFSRAAYYLIGRSPMTAANAA